MDWHYPVASKFATAAKAGQTRARAARVALPREKAFYTISGDNRKPLLVLRECTHCKGTEHALFSRKLNNEKTMLLAQWFRCVKLPADVLEKNHPFRHAFTKENAPHLFLSRWDGSNVVPFNGRQTQSSLWKAMTAMVEAEYRKKPAPALKAMLRHLSAFDNYDALEKELADRIEKEREKSGPNSSKVKKLRKKLATVLKNKEGTMKRAKAVCDLKLKVVKKPAKPAKAAAKAGGAGSR